MQNNLDPKTFPRRTVVQAMHADKILLHTAVINFYIQHGFRISKVHRVYEYQPSRCFKKVHDTVYEARVKATVDNDTMRATAVKLCSNSMYGQSLMVCIS